MDNRSDSSIKYILIIGGILIILLFLLLSGGDLNYFYKVIDPNYSPNKIASNLDYKFINLVFIEITNNQFNLKSQDLSTMNNPNGEGVFVYVPKTNLKGVERYLMWLVMNDQVFPLNGSSKDLTPNLKWPREIDEKIWSKTGLNPLMPSESIKILFGE